MFFSSVMPGLVPGIHDSTQDVRRQRVDAHGSRWYGASGEPMAQSSLQQTDEVPHAAAE
jgi:hypothetical protein